MLKQDGIIPSGSYGLFLDGKDTGKDVLVDTKTDVVTLNFYTLDTAFDSLLGGVDIVPAWVTIFDGETAYLEDSKVQLTAREGQSGYIFGYWVGIGPAPSYAKGSSELSNPTALIMCTPLEMRAGIAASWLPCFLRCQLFRCYGVYGGSKTLLRIGIEFER